MSFLTAAVTAIVLSPVLAALGVRFGLVDRPGDLKIHDRPIPVTGGPAVVAAALFGLVVTGHADPWIGAATCLALAGGLFDDTRPLPPWTRLVVQAGAGVLLVAGGLRIEPLGAFGGAALVVATVALCNAVNMMDGQDGLAAGLGTIAALGLAAVAASRDLPAALSLGLAGSLAGFLVWNKPPARIFLGDGGAYALGVLLAASAADTTALGWHGLLVAGACLGVFAYELASTITRRLAASSPTVRGDRDHSYDRLAGRLGSRVAATLIMWTLGTLAALVGLAELRMHPIPGVALILAVTLVAALLDVRVIPVPVGKEDP